MNRVFHLIAALFWLAWQAPLLAHSALDHSEPKEGAVLKAVPNELRIWFSEPVKVALSTVEVRNEAGKQIDRHDLRADEKEPVMLHLSLMSEQGPGTLQVAWVAVAQDMHVTKGSFTFRVVP